MSKLIKVTLEFEDEILEVEGEDCFAWHERVSVLETLSASREWLNLPEVNWKKTKK
jgi:hypothetical protein